MPWNGVVVYNSDMAFRNKESANEYYRNYRKTTETRFAIAFRNGQDDDVIEYLRKCPNKSEKIRRWVRKEIADMDR